MNIKETKQNIILAGHKAVLELIKVAEESILSGTDTDPEPEKLKNAAATKKLAIFDAFEILSRIEEEEKMLEEGDKETTVKQFKGFAEGRSK
jgi:hypothetical protein